MRNLNFYLFVLIVAVIPVYGMDLEHCGDCEQMLKNSPTFHYPYSDLHLILENEGRESIKIFSYGSLMDFDSAANTLSEQSMKTFKPAVAFGVKRLFNRDVPIKPNSKWGIPKNENARGMLNLVKEEDQMVNGVIFEVRREDIPSLLYREEGYDLIPVIAKDWEANNAKCDIAYTFYAPPESPYTSNSIDPRPKYYELSRDAAKHYGPEFYDLWFSSTYLSDGKTPIVEWEKMVQNKEPITEVQ